MKHFLFFICILLLSASSYGQNDSVRTLPNRWMHLHLANGVNFIRNEALKNSYANNALYFWGVGVRMGNPQKPKIFFDADYNFSNYQLSTEVNKVRQDSVLKINQLILSLSVELVRWNTCSVRTKAGYIVAFLKDDVTKLDKVLPGFKVGLSIENKIFQSQAVHFDLDYDLMKAKGNSFQDYDVWKLSVGVYL